MWMDKCRRRQTRRASSRNSPIPPGGFGFRVAGGYCGMVGRARPVYGTTPPNVRSCLLARLVVLWAAGHTMPHPAAYYRVGYNAPGKLDRGISYKAVSETGGKKDHDDTAKQL